MKKKAFASKASLHYGGRLVPFQPRLGLLTSLMQASCILSCTCEEKSEVCAFKGFRCRRHDMCVEVQYCNLGFISLYYRFSDDAMNSRKNRFRGKMIEWREPV